MDYSYRGLRFLIILLLVILSTVWNNFLFIYCFYFQSLSTLFFQLYRIGFHYLEGYKYDFLNGIPMDQIEIVGDVLTIKNSSYCHELDDDEEGHVEYLDEFCDVSSLKFFLFFLLSYVPIFSCNISFIFFL